MKKIFMMLVLATSVVFACTKIFGTLELSNRTFRALKGAPNGSAYLTITQTADTADKLISASSDVAGRVEIHDHITDPVTKIKRMVEIKTIDIPGKKEDCWFITCWFAKPKPVEFVKGGKHLMLMELKPSANELKEIEIKLVFEKAGEVTAKFKAESVLGAASTVCEHHKH